jgi:ribosomal-protein-alanine N-acetyltransferase
VRVPPLETERLVVRELRPGDEIADVVGERRDEWLRWTVNSYARYAELIQPPYGERGAELRDTGQLVGLVGLVPSLGPFALLPSLSGGAGDARRYTPEVGLFWETAPEHRGRGYATEAARALIDHAFTELNLQRVVATTEHQNLASIAVMRKLGMRIETNPDAEPPWFQTVGVLHAG